MAKVTEQQYPTGSSMERLRDKVVDDDAKKEAAKSRDSELKSKDAEKPKSSDN